MNKMKIWLEQTMMISFAILVGIIIEGLCFTLFASDSLYEFKMDLLQMVSIVLTGAVCSLPTVLWLVDAELPKNKFTVRIILHCIGLYAIVSLFGWLFKWYTKADGFIFMTVIYFAVYVFTWNVTLWFHKRDDKRINKALDNIRDEE